MPRKKRIWVSLGAGVLAICCLSVMQRPLCQWVSVTATLSNPSPPADQVESVIKNSTDCERTIIMAWNTGKIIQREVAARELADPSVTEVRLSDKLETIALTGCLDADFNVREWCLMALDTRKDPALAALASAQLKDCDPQARLLGLQHLRHVEADLGVPAIVPVLDDDDPEVAATALKLLEHWIGQNFDIRVRDVLPTDDPTSENPDRMANGVAKLKSAVGLAKQWWAQHRTEYTSAIPPIPKEAFMNHGPVAAGDFSLPDLNGGKAKLADYRGKVVVINFWTTWCTACIAEIPELVQLENRHNGEVVVLGVSLDSLPDDDGDQAPTNSLAEIKGKVARVVASKNINYPVFLDVHDDAGGQYNGGELPTTVIVDADGSIRRRFVGSRKPKTFDAMIIEAKQPLGSIQKQAVAVK